MATPYLDRHQQILNDLRLARGALTHNYEEALRLLCAEERARCIAAVQAIDIDDLREAGMQADVYHEAMRALIVARLERL